MFKELAYDWGGANTWLFHAINDVRGEFIDSAMIAGTNAGNHKLFPVYLALFFVIALTSANNTLRRDYQQGLGLTLLWMSALSVFSLSYVIDGAFLVWVKPFLGFPRPPLALGQDSLHILGEPEFYNSLPSGHASFAMLIGASFWKAVGRKGRPVLAAFVFWVGISRISVGAHFPADVLASWLTALAVVSIIRAIVSRALPGSLPLDSTQSDK